MLFMVIEKYSHGPGPVYERAAERGRMLPEGLRYVDSWIVDDGRLDRCFQIMETDNPELFDVWRARWADLGDFKVFRSSSPARQHAASAFNGTPRQIEGDSCPRARCGPPA